MYWLVEEVPYNIFFCDTSSTSATEEEAPTTEEDTAAHSWAEAEKTFHKEVQK